LLENGSNDRFIRKRLNEEIVHGVIHNWSHETNDWRVTDQMICV